MFIIKQEYESTMNIHLAMVSVLLMTGTMIIGSIISVIPTQALENDWCWKDPNGDYYQKHKEYCDAYYNCIEPPYAGKEDSCDEYYGYCGNEWYYNNNEYCKEVWEKPSSSSGSSSNSGGSNSGY
ncbi:hypothetical protein NARC_40126 [Candidatus Nitrosocosmicus arcticus]|uniref:Uncharacterized protein n=2 Tax=Candidatus Nitrosocosmicus arcticus TaxID=2035267 RepID=A0A557SX39_9ARCH|nr:hypothetical protein NARC_40126 [Candidatus Nitrosocosmicus arcticus]